MPRILVRKTSSLSFDGTLDYVSFGDNLQKDKDDAFSVSAWIKPNTISGDLSIVRKNLLGPTSQGWMTRLESGKLDMWMTSNTGANAANATSTTFVVADVWQFVTFTYDGSESASGINFYINGRLQPKTNDVDVLTGSTLSTADLRIGSHLDDTQVFDGLIADVKVHSKALTESEVYQVYRGHSVSEEAHWKLDEGSGSSVADSVGSYTGTITGAAWSSDGPHQRRIPVRNYQNSLSFDGSNDSVDCDGAEVANGAAGDTCTVSLWFKATSPPAAFAAMYGEGSSSTIVPFFTVGMLSDGTVGISTRNDASYTVNSFGSVDCADGQWHQITCVRNGSDLTTFIDGNTDSSTTDATYDASNLTLNTTTIGALTRTSEVNNFGGLITHVRCWSTNLTHTEVVDLYRGYSIPQQASLVHEYLFSEGSGTSLADTGSAAITGTIEDGAAWSTDAPFDPRNVVTTARTAITAARTAVS